MGQRNELRALGKYTGLAPRRWLALLTAGCTLFLGAGLATAATPEAAGGALRDGQHDFDFSFGVWKTHIRRVLDPLSGSDASLEMNGTVTKRKVWGGRAELEEIEADGPQGHWEGMTLFLYNPTAHQWSQTFVNSRDGMMGTPLIGEFANGRGNLYSTDTFKGRAILVRGTWSDIKPDSHRYTESYSADGGATWAAAFIADLTRKQS